MNAADFRASFPEFGNEQTYPPAVIDRHLRVANMRVSGDRWGELLDEGIGLFVAHHLVLHARQIMVAEMGGIPGEIVAPKSSKTVGPVSSSYDVASVSLTDAGHFNATSYGAHFYQMVLIVGAGPLQI